jgi:hypothetical protein
MEIVPVSPMLRPLGPSLRHQFKLICERQMNRRAVVLTATAMLLGAPTLAQARTLNCTPEAVAACKAEMAPLCRQAPRALAAKCRDDLAEQCATPSVLCERSDLDSVFRRSRRPPLHCDVDDPMDINPDPSQPVSPRTFCR